jgi:phage shock protein C
MEPMKTCVACLREIDVRASRCSHCGAQQLKLDSMHRDVPGRMVAGVCAALGQQFGIDATILRIGFVIAFIVSAGLAFWISLAVGMLTPPHAGGRAPFAKAIDFFKGLLNQGQPIVDEPQPPSVQ